LNGLNGNLPLESVEFNLSILLIKRAVCIKHKHLRNDKESWLPHSIGVLLQQITVELIAIGRSDCKSFFEKGLPFDRQVLLNQMGHHEECFILLALKLNLGNYVCICGGFIIGLNDERALWVFYLL